MATHQEKCRPRRALWSGNSAPADTTWSSINFNVFYFWVYIFPYCLSRQNFLLSANVFTQSCRHKSKWNCFHRQTLQKMIPAFTAAAKSPVVSDSMWSHRWQPTRLPRPPDSQGKNTGVGCHFLLQCVKVKSESEVAQTCQTLSDPMDCSLPGSSIHEIFQARVLEWGAICLLRLAFTSCAQSSYTGAYTSPLQLFCPHIFCNSWYCSRILSCFLYDLYSLHSLSCKIFNDQKNALHAVLWRICVTLSLDN